MKYVQLLVHCLLQKIKEQQTPEENEQNCLEA